ncbi:MAG: carotenoid 1,2-hydratase [Deltaproteobacteria bacterium]|nr:carotenoid 1,2-hydratase [Deltaproteobacteria bacterium]
MLGGWKAWGPLTIGAALALLLSGAVRAAPVPANVWAPAAAPRHWSFPRDHGAHPDFRTEWWYFTGNLAGPSGRRYGYQLTFFRQGIRPKPLEPRNAWSVRDLYLAHVALTDPSGDRFRYAERTSRTGPGLAGASSAGLDVWLLGWSARQEGGRIQLKATTGELALELELEARKPVVLHGQGGLSRKGAAAGQASYYASLTDLSTRGRVRVGAGGSWVPVTGTSWFDQEFGSNQLSAGQVGWDWVSLHLSDRRDLMLYLLRRADGTVEPSSSGTLVEADGSARHLPLSDLSLAAVAHWTSPRTGARYPSRWRVRVASAGIDLELTPWLADQELVTTASTGVVYWEGAASGRGVSGGRPATCEGYVELTGYGGAVGGLF